MNHLRPEALAILWRWSEAAAASVAMGTGLWLMGRGGYFLAAVGGVALLLAAGWLLIALRRLRFSRPGSAPGLVELDEGQITYLGPTFGGSVAVRELTEVRLLVLNDTAHWRLKQADGQALLVPHGARGAEGLFDAFAALPGIDMARVSAAPASGERDIVVWHRRAQVPLT